MLSELWQAAVKGLEVNCQKMPWVASGGGWNFSPVILKSCVYGSDREKGLGGKQQGHAVPLWLQLEYTCSFVSFLKYLSPLTATYREEEEEEEDMEELVGHQLVEVVEEEEVAGHHVVEVVLAGLQEEDVALEAQEEDPVVKFQEEVSVVGVTLLTALLHLPSLSPTKVKAKVRLITEENYVSSFLSAWQKRMSALLSHLLGHCFSLL